MKRLGVVVPVFNTEPYLAQCIESILNQSYMDFELVLVNDGSTDKSEEKINKYINKITYIKKENSGLSDTRNIGIEKATGENHI